MLDIAYNKNVLKEALNELKRLMINCKAYLDLGSGEGVLTRFVVNILELKGLYA